MVILTCLFSLILEKNFPYVRIEGFALREKMAVRRIVTSIVGSDAGKK